ncbi:MAG: hypothetical protein ACI9O0_000929 [Paracoccaceae bacterium]|jgi:hypothetical protein
MLILGTAFFTIMLMAIAFTNSVARVQFFTAGYASARFNGQETVTKLPPSITKLQNILLLFVDSVASFIALFNFVVLILTHSLTLALIIPLEGAGRTFPRHPTLGDARGPSLNIFKSS